MPRFMCISTRAWAPDRPKCLRGDDAVRRSAGSSSEFHVANSPGTGTRPAAARGDLLSEM